ncbi:MAG: integration host factor [Pseudomonas putida]|nr:MAG: integration host factor [Pseudomonas putida]
MLSWQHGNNNKKSRQRGFTMRKPELAAVIAEKADLTKEKANQVLNAILDSITGALDKDTVTLVGFGTFEKRHRGARTGKNPQTGEPVKIKASNTVAFKPGKNLKDSVNAPAKPTKKGK